MKLAVIFPGIGYHVDKPLLYYGKKLAIQLGYEIKQLPYGGFPKDVKGSEKKMKEAFLSALSQAEQMLENTDFAAYEELLFISKSVGTAVAVAYAGAHGLTPRHIYFTPVEQSFACMTGRKADIALQPGIVFHGTNDPWVETDIVKDRCSALKLPLYITENADHSLETGDALRDTENLHKILEICRGYLEAEK